MSVAEMSMSRWMCSHTKLARIRNECIQEEVHVAHVGDKMRDGCLIWFGHVYRRPTEAPVGKSDNLEDTGGKRGGGRPKLT